MKDLSEILTKIKKLSLSSEEQIRYLKNLGTYPLLDELVLEFDDAFLALKGKNYGNLEDFERLNSLLDKLNEKENTEVWDVKSLDTHPWEEIRKFSKSLLLKYNDILGNGGNGNGADVLL